MSELTIKAMAINKAARLLRDLVVEVNNIGFEEFTGPVIEPILELADAIESISKRYMAQIDRGNLRILEDLAMLEKPEVLDG